MTPEQQRITIAEVCPKLFSYLCYENPSENEFWIHTKENLLKTDPLFDLNVMHEVEKALRGYQRTKYTVELRKIIVRDMDVQGHQDPDTGTLLDIYFYGATAAQRAEAFLRTLDLWNDTK